MSDTPLQKTRVLTPQAEDDRDAFIAKYGSGNCSCHISPPCSSCTHPGNPLNQEEDDSCWEEPIEAKEMSESKHTPEPWSVHPTLAQIISNDPDSPICGMLWPTEDRSKDETFANARRIVSAVNACANISTEALEAGVVKELIGAANRMLGCFLGDTEDAPLTFPEHCDDPDQQAAFIEIFEGLSHALAKIGGAS